MSQQKYIGGFFELEVPEGGQVHHPDALALTTGRACIKWILEREQPTQVHVPFYTCDALYEPMVELGIPIQYYALNEDLEAVELPEPQASELLIVINYFGIKGDYVNGLANRYGKRIIIDNTHQFFHRSYPEAYSFTSARKYFGVPDGAYLYSDNDNYQTYVPNSEVSIDPNLKRFMGRQAEAFQAYQAYEKSLGCQIRGISKISDRLLAGVNYDAVSKIRKSNFNFLQDHLRGINCLTAPFSSEEVPFCYPFLPEKEIAKKYFYDQNVFIPSLWPDVNARDESGFDWEKDFSNRLLPLPIDHRYGESEMQKMINLIIERSR